MMIARLEQVALAGRLVTLLTYHSDLVSQQIVNLTIQDQSAWLKFVFATLILLVKSVCVFRSERE